MKPLTETLTVPPFPTRYPIRPPLALPRRNRSEVMPEWPAGVDAVPGLSADAERALRRLENSLADRERAVAEAEARLAERNRDLAEMEALLHARESLLASSLLRHPDKRGIVTIREAEALNGLKAELDQQEANLREARQTMRDREKFMEESETRLFQKVQEQQEKEMALEQREEDLAAREARLQEAASMLGASGPSTQPAPAPKRAYDEWRE
ncbi:hypothetical protein [Opitutus terrae]|uniref:Uncharacterized protein n=1 Tax=Opitutus terrae (strain DSM 11246 / JCM 15787 / PB90-1) TaxID=452637 RepID=B1ZWB9_OPITP|nr:hypothetical protein [Opitutus terrae]ACB76871.1 hypothetical protein Oter_3594 [Opitutus terrae PB90-1]